MNLEFKVKSKTEFDDGRAAVQLEARADGSNKDSLLDGGNGYLSINDLKPAAANLFTPGATVKVEISNG